MLLQKLEQASKEASLRSSKIVIFAVGTGLIVGLTILSISLYREVVDLRRSAEIGNTQRFEKEPSSSGATNTTSTPSQSQGPEPATAIDQNPKGKNLERLEEPRVTVSKKEVVFKKAREPSMEPRQSEQPLSTLDTLPSLTAPLNPSAGIVSQTVSTGNEPLLSPDDTRKLRSEFKATLKLFVNQLEPELTSVGFSNWNPAAQKDILFLKKSGVSQFSAADLESALTSIRKAVELAKKHLTEKQKLFVQYMTDAASAKSIDDFKSAKKNVDQALALSPGSNEAKRLSAEIKSLPDILKYISAANVARVENNSKKELMNLRKVLKLDPSRLLLKERAAFLSNEIKERTFAGHISEGLNYVKKRRLRDAELSLEAAKKLFSKREELAILADKIFALESELKIRNLLYSANDAAQRDDWKKALKLYESAKKIQPNNQDASVGVALANSILDLNSQISLHLSASNRLSSKNVALIASNLIKKSERLNGKSKSLDTKTRKLSYWLRAYTTDVLVRIISDGQSRVSVKGVGQVGTVKEKIIKLNPGTYIFESTRRGYKSKLLKFEIPPHAKGLKIRIFCDEQV